jgi:ribokinase
VEPDGTNRIIIIPGANHAMSPEDARHAIESWTGGVVLGQLEIPQHVTAAGFEAARERGATTVLNPAPAAPLDDGLLAVTDWLIPNEVEYATISGLDAHADGALARFAGEAGVRLVVTLGERGAALVAGDGEVIRLPAAAVEATDTTGAGDAFVGAFAYGLAAGLDEIGAVRLGLACASDSVTRPGTQSSFRRPDRTTELLARPPEA